MPPVRKGIFKCLVLAQTKVPSAQGIHQPEETIFLKVYERVHKLWVNCSSTYLSGNRSAHRLEKLTVWIAQTVGSSFALLWRLKSSTQTPTGCFNSYMNESLTVRITFSSRTVAGRLNGGLIACVSLIPNTDLFSWRNLVYAHRPFTPPAYGGGSSWSSTPAITKEVAQSCSSALTAHMFGIFSASLMAVYRI